MDFSRSKIYIVFAAVILFVALMIAIYTFIENYIDERKAKKRKVVFKTKNGKTKGYWKTKEGEKYDKDLKLED